MMQLRDVLLKATARQITWGEAAEIIGVSDRTIQKLRERLEREGSLLEAEHRKRSFSRKRSSDFRARIVELRTLIAIHDEVSGSIAAVQSAFVEPMPRGTGLAGFAMEAARRIEAVPTDHARVFRVAPQGDNLPEPKKRGMGIASPRPQPARLRN